MRKWHLQSGSRRSAMNPSVRAFTYLLDDMLYRATIQGESHLIQRIFSH
jgi:hypothetical protein